MSQFYVWMSCTEHIQGFSEIPNVWMFHRETIPSPWSLKMSDINLVIKCNTLMEM